MPWYLLAPAILAAGVAGYMALRRLGGDKIVLIQRRLGDANYIARELVPQGYQVYFVETPQDVLDAIADHRLISRVTIVSHGGPDWVLNRGLTYDLLARALGPRLAYGAVVGLAGCSGGRSSQEPSEWTAQAFMPGGVGSYAWNLALSLWMYGAPSSVEVRAHAVRGHTMANPSGRIFMVGNRAPGRSVMPVGEDMQAFISRFGGEPAAAWILGA